MRSSWPVNETGTLSEGPASPRPSGPISGQVADRPRGVFRGIDLGLADGPGGVAAGTGLLAIALEIFWTVLFAQVLHNSVYSFAAVSLVFLLAIAGGAELSALLLRFVSRSF